MQTMHVLIGALKTIVPVTTESVLNTKLGSLKHFFSTNPSRLGIYLCKIPTSCDHTENFDSI